MIHAISISIHNRSKMFSSKSHNSECLGNLYAPGEQQEVKTWARNVASLNMNSASSPGLYSPPLNSCRIEQSKENLSHSSLG